MKEKKCLNEKSIVKRISKSERQSIYGGRDHDKIQGSICQTLHLCDCLAGCGCPIKQDSCPIYAGV